MENEDKEKYPEKNSLSLGLILQKQNKLNEKIQDLAKNTLTEQKKIEEVLSFFKNEIYVDGFRHNYSDFFPVIAKIYQEDSDFSSQTLQENIAIIRKVLDDDFQQEKPVFKNARNSILKLFDHITLELYRFENNSMLIEQVGNSKQEIEHYKTALEKVRDELKIAKDTNEKSLEKISKVQGETISIISIFAAVTLAFSGGLSYITSALTTLNTAPFFRVTFLIILIGLILFNVIFVLLYVVARMTDKTIFITCQSKTCEECKKSVEEHTCKDCVQNSSLDIKDIDKKLLKKVQKERKKSCKSCSKYISTHCNGLKKIRRCYPYLVWTDIILFILLGITLVGVFCWDKLIGEPMHPNDSSQNFIEYILT